MVESTKSGTLEDHNTNSEINITSKSGSLSKSNVSPSLMQEILTATSGSDINSESLKYDEGMSYFVGSSLSTPTPIPRVAGLTTQSFDPTILWILFYTGFVIAIFGAVWIFKKHAAK